jgi:hypothetical protein
MIINDVRVKTNTLSATSDEANLLFDAPYFVRIFWNIFFVSVKMHILPLSFVWL